MREKCKAEFKKGRIDKADVHPGTGYEMGEKEHPADIHILIVDDESCIREILSWALRHMGFQVSVASNGFEALGMFMQGSFDLVLTDLNMPGMDGWLLAHKIKKSSPDTVVVLLTGEEPAMVREKLPGSWVDFVLFKPFRLEEIENAVRRLLHQSRASSSVR